MRSMLALVAGFITLSSTLAFAQSISSEGTSETRQERFYEDKLRFEVAYTSGSFYYAEPNMTEHDPMSGVVGRVRAPIGQTDMFWGADLEYVDGHGNYNGQTWGGDPVTTTTSTNILTTRGLFGTNLDLSNSLVAQPFIGLGARDLNNKDDGPGTYRREITYLYLPLGTDLTWHIGHSVEVGVSAEYDLFVSGTVKTDLSDVGGSDVQNTQSSGSGYRAAVHVAWIAGRMKYSIEPYLQGWSIGNSNYVFEGIDDKGNSHYILEPDNKSTLAGTNFSVTF